MEKSCVSQPKIQMPEISSVSIDRIVIDGLPLTDVVEYRYHFEDTPIGRIIHAKKHLYLHGDSRGKKAAHRTICSHGELENEQIRLCLTYLVRVIEHEQDFRLIIDLLVTNDTAARVERVIKGNKIKRRLIAMSKKEILFHRNSFVDEVCEEIEEYLYDRFGQDQNLPPKTFSETFSTEAF